MALLPQDRQSQYMLLITMAMVALGYFFWTYWVQPTNAKIAATRAEADSLQTIVDRAKQDLASGTVDDLRRKVEEYQALLSVMRRLVPERNEVPALIDDISTKSKVRGVTIGRFEPLAVEPGQPFDTYRYRLEILRHREPAAHRRAAGSHPQAGAAAGAESAVRHGRRVARGPVLDPDLRQGRAAASGARREEDGFGEAGGGG